MSYDPTIPKAVDRPSASQGAMLTNFGQLNTQFGIEHSSLRVGPGNGDGKHKYITLKQAPGAAAPAGTDLILSQELSNSTPFIRVLNSAAQSWPFLLTKAILGIATPAGDAFTNIINMAPTYDSTVGFILMWPDAPKNSQQLFTTYTFPHAASPKASGAQFVPGGSSHMLGITFSGNTLQVHTDGVLTVNTLIGWVAI